MSKVVFYNKCFQQISGEEPQDPCLSLPKNTWATNSLHANEL